MARNGANSLDQRIFLVTGAAGGIGLSTVLLALRRGALVVALDQAEKVPDALAPYILAGSASYLRLDLTKASAEDAVRLAALPFGLPSVLINNAALMQRGRFVDTTRERLETVLFINTIAPILLTRTLLRAWLAAPRHEPLTVVNVSSTNALGGEATQFEYSLSKAAINTFTKNASNAHPPSLLRINALNVGWTLTEAEIQRKIADGFPDGWEQNEATLGLPLGRLLRPNEIAEHILFWASPASAPVSGAIYEVAQNGR